MEIICPVCKKELFRDNRSYTCDNGHRFDIARQGYVNLYLKQSHKSYGDGPLLSKARHSFFAKDHYRSLKEKLVTIVKDLNVISVLDCGCGDGYYTNYLKKSLPDLDILGIDISKEMLKLANDNSGVLYVVADNHQLPVRDQSIDLILNCFVPQSLSEYQRILKDSGYLVVVNPDIDHLFELKKAVYDTPYLNKLKYLPEDWVKVEEYHLKDEIYLDNNRDIKELFSMTPYSYKTSERDKQKLDELDHLDLTLAFHICIYQKAVRP